MTNDSFYEQGSKVLTRVAFQFVLDTELRRAVRAQNFLTLVLVQTSQDRDGAAVTLDDRALLEVGSVLGREVRETDLLGHTDDGTLAVVLLDADYESSERVINRIVTRIEQSAFPKALRVSLGAACYPTHAVDAVSLRQQALNRSVVNCRSQALPPQAN